jgi:hypothetical protein
MANLSESATYDAGVYQLETTDPLLGGALGILNSAPKNLANRTAYLKAHVDALEDVWSGMTTVTLTGDVDVTLSEAEAAHGIIKLDGVLTDDINVIVPTGITRQWLFISEFSGSDAGTPYAVTIKTAAGAGCVLTQSSQIHVMTDGVDVIGQSARHRSVTNGYVTMFQGLILQFGVKNPVPASGVAVDVTLPIEFPNDCIGVLATLFGDSADGYVSAQPKDGTSNTTITLKQSNAAERNVAWLAIGY